MAEKQEQRTLIYEERNTKVVSQKDRESEVRIARFLKPCAEHVNQAVGIPNSPLLSEFFHHNLQHWPSKVLFKGWYCPQRRWREWVNVLAEKYGAIWNQTGTCDAIASSIYEVRCNLDLMLGLSEFWCPDTNTFVFPWGEATITLEDVTILGGFPVVGEPVTVPLPEELAKIEQEMIRQRTKMSRSKSRKAAHSTWLNHFMENEREMEFEHVAFLCLWLSRYVFPSLPEKTIGKHVFPIAAFLSRGTPMALAPAVLACLYRDMRSLREQAMGSKESIVVSGRFQLVQLWALERFPLVGPNIPNLLLPGEPRVARWHKLNLKINLPLVRSALQLAKNFQWRPFAANLENWRHPSYYRETEQLLVNSSSLDGELRSFFRCLQVSELVGVDCKEKYLPNRVAMQFGMDQDLPADPSGFDFSCENVGFFVPARSFQPGFSQRYIKWWKDMMLARECAIKEVFLMQRRQSKVLKDTSSVEANRNGAKYRRVNPLTPSLSSTKGNPSPVDRCDGNKTPLVVVSINPELKSRTSSSVQAQKSNGRGELDQVLTKSDSKKNREADSPDIPSGIQEEQIHSDSSDGDHLPIATRFELRYGGAKISREVGSSTSTIGNEERRKRVAAGKSINNGPNGIGREVKTEVGCSVNEAIDVDAPNGAAEIGKRRRKAGVSLHNPVCVDGYVEINKTRFEKDGKDLEGRVEKLEKMLGVVPD